MSSTCSVAEAMADPAPIHGGRLDEAMVRFGGARADWIDLSTGINPWPWPVAEVAPQAWTRLPDAAAVEATTKAARRCYGTPADAVIIAGNGSQALIQALPLCLDPTTVAVVGLTYREHERCWTLAGHRVRSVPDLGAVPEGTDVVVLVNPNNPDGRTVAPGVLLDVADRLAGRGGLLVVDEAFADVAPAISVAAETGRPGLCVLRSFGKFFGLAGVRIGFALCDDRIGAALAARLGPWPTSGIALDVAARALADDEWVSATRARLAGAMAALRETIARCGLTVIGSTDLYALVDCADAGRLWRSLCAAHILTRPFPERPRWLRLGLPATAEAAQRLGDALGSGP
jgi:cobalamin biosynthetic protein CobC